MILLIAGMGTIGHTHRAQHSRTGQLTSAPALTGTVVNDMIKDKWCHSGWHDLELEATFSHYQELHGVPVVVYDQVWDPSAECGMMLCVGHNSTGNHSPAQDCTELNFPFLAVSGEAGSDTVVLIEIPRVYKIKEDVMEGDPGLKIMKIVMEWDTSSQLHEEFWLTALDKPVGEVSSPVFFGWCTDYQGTNAGNNCHSEERQGQPEEQPGWLPDGGHQDGGHWHVDQQVRGSPYGFRVRKSRRMGGASISKDNDFAQHSSFHNMYEQKSSVLDGGGHH